MMASAILSFISILLCCGTAHAWSNAPKHTCRVKSLGGGRDDGPSIMHAFSECANDGLIILDGAYYVGTLLVANLTNTHIEFTGSVTYTPDIPYWNASSYPLLYQNATTYWLLTGTNISLVGGGTINANGQVWWDRLALINDQGVAGGSSTTFARPVSLAVVQATNVYIDALQQVASPFWNNFVYESQNVTYNNSYINVTSYEPNSPPLNSDGWDIYRSSYITISNAIVQNFDDCVSFKPNSTNILIENSLCVGSDGIAIGSVGQYYGVQDIVENVLVRNVTIDTGLYGARMKVFGGSNDTQSVEGGGYGRVTNVTFENMKVIDVDNPIDWWQCFSTPPSDCLAFPTGINISSIHHINITGTSSGLAGALVVDLECAGPGCTDITASGINITAPNVVAGQEVYYCRDLVNPQLDFPCTPFPEDCVAYRGADTAPGPCNATVPPAA